MPTRMHGLRRRFFVRSLIKYLSIILLPLLICIALMVWTYFFQMTGIIKEDTKRAATLSALNFTELFQELAQLQLFVDSSAEVHLGLLQVLQEDNPSPEAFASLLDLARFEQVSMKAKPYILSYYIGKPESPYVLVNGERLLVQSFSDSSWMEPFAASHGKILVSVRRMRQYAFEKEGSLVISLYQRTKYNEIIVANIRPTYFSSFLASSGHHVSLVDKDGCRVLGSDGGSFVSDDAEGQSFLASLARSSQHGLWHDRKFVIMAPLNNVGLYFVDEIPHTVLFSSLYRIGIISVLVIISAIFVSIVLALYFTRREYLKVCRILRLFDAHSPSDSNLTIEYSRGDVYVYILETAIEMFSSRAKLEKELLSHQVELVGSQLRALQYQINPHFMFNTLQAIDNAVLQEVHHSSRANSMIGIFSQLLRYSIANPTELVSLEEEIEVSRKFVLLEQYRLVDGLQVFWDYDDTMLKLRTIRLVFEPLIENAIAHGRFSDGRKLMIRIALVKRDGHILVSVFDNGPGVTQGELERLRSVLHDNTENGHFGLKNVHERLSLQFGKEYGIHLHSHQGKGFCVFFRIPADK